MKTLVIVLFTDLGAFPLFVTEDRTEALFFWGRVAGEMREGVWTHVAAAAKAMGVEVGNPTAAHLQTFYKGFPVESEPIWSAPA